MNKITTLFLLTLLVISVSVSAQSIRGFYLQDVGDWLGNSTKENEILTYAQGNGFNYILFYDLGDINWSSSTEKNQLGAFMHKARTQYGILQIGGVIEYAGYASQKLIPYNNSRNQNTEKFDVINLEFEFWVSSSISNSYCSKFLTPAGLSCNSSGAWTFAWDEFKKIDDLCAANGLMSEFYLGWPDLTQMQKIAGRADRILLSAYRPTDSDIYAYSKGRMKDIASIGGVTKVLTLLSSESSFMGPWLATHPQSRPFNTFAAALAAETGSFKNNIDLQGYHWFTYKYMPKTISATATITAGGPLTFCPGGNVTLTANSGAAYLWTPGGQTTRSITVSGSGTYTVKVTSSSGVAVVSAPVVVSNNGSGATPVITPSGSTSFCSGGSVTLTSSTASAYVWSNGATTQSITVSNSGTYTVTAGSSTCSGVSAPVTVNANWTPPVPTVTSNGSLNVCQGTVLTLTSSSANGYLWSTGETTRSIVVPAAGNYSVRAYHGPNCFKESATKTVTILPAPATPVIATKRSTTLTPTNSSIVLTSSVAPSYLWSNGSTSRSITVSSQGSYSVTVTGTNGCTAMSNHIAVSANGCTPPAAPVITVNGSSVITSGQTVTLTSSAAGGYLWSNGAQTQSITVNSSGNYTVRAYNAGGCYATSAPVAITVVLARESNDIADITSTENSEFDQVNLYPNPATSFLNLSFNKLSENSMAVKLMDLTGRELRHTDLSDASGEHLYSLDVSNLSKGIYFISLLSNNQKKTLKFMVE